MSAKLLFKLFALISILVALLGGAYWWYSLPFHRLPVDQAARLNSLFNPEVIKPSYIDLAYAEDSPFQKLDLYLPTNKAGPFPVVIWIHGGGLIMGDKSSLPRTDFGPAPKPQGNWGPYQIQVPDLSLLLQQGFAVASLNYRLGLSPVTAADSAIKDGKSAVRYLRNHAEYYGLDKDRFAVWGNSMGGYLAAMLGITGQEWSDFDTAEQMLADVSSAVQVVVVWFGAESRMPGELELKYQIEQSSQLPPFLIVNGDMDPVVTPQQALELSQQLKKSDAKVKLVIVPGAGHEDPLFMQTQVRPSIDFISTAFESFGSESDSI